MKEKEIKTFVVGPSIGYSRFIEGRVLVDNIEDAQVVVFTGGEDIEPSIYGKKRHHSVYTTPSRDRMELKAYKKVREDQLIVGVCRGAQLACALNGGILVQDCSNHWGCGQHEITNGEETFMITSIHHQMMYPFDIPKENYSILYKSLNNLSKYYEGEGVDPEVISKEGEPEIIMFHTPGCPKALAIQGHPEMMVGSPVSEMINKIIRENVKNN